MRLIWILPLLAAPVIAAVAAAQPVAVAVAAPVPGPEKAAELPAGWLGRPGSYRSRRPGRSHT
jgi:hypothetical protein